METKPKTTCKKQHHERMNELTLLTWYNRKARREIQTIQEQQIDTEMGYSFSSSAAAAAAAAVAGGDGEKLLWIAQRWCALSRMRRRRTQGVGSSCVWLPLFLPHRELPSFLCDFFSSFALFFPPFVVELEKRKQKKQTFLVRLQPFLFLF